jgi:hypothetical protein
MLRITLSVASSVMDGVVASVPSVTVAELIICTGVVNSEVLLACRSTVWLATFDVPETDLANTDTESTRYGQGTLNWMGVTVDVNVPLTWNTHVSYPVLPVDGLSVAACTGMLKASNARIIIIIKLALNLFIG